ncbi:MAG: hypothetical protein JKY23_04445 [Nitrospinaceae bacterium]|nr:hypothetical protein [Nitrospinaceae bacterium]
MYINCHLILTCRLWSSQHQVDSETCEPHTLSTAMSDSVLTKRNHHTAFARPPIKKMPDVDEDSAFMLLNLWNTRHPHTIETDFKADGYTNVPTQDAIMTSLGRQLEYLKDDTPPATPPLVTVSDDADVCATCSAVVGTGALCDNDHPACASCLSTSTCGGCGISWCPECDTCAKCPAHLCEHSDHKTLCQWCAMRDEKCEVCDGSDRIIFRCDARHNACMDCFIKGRCPDCDAAWCKKCVSCSGCQRHLCAKLECVLDLCIKCHDKHEDDLNAQRVLLTGKEESKSGPVLTPLAREKNLDVVSSTSNRHDCGCVQTVIKVVKDNHHVGDDDRTCMMLDRQASCALMH